MKNNLYTSLVALHDRENRNLVEIDNVENRSFRYAAYRQFCWFVHGRIGKAVRRVIPACVVSKIRQEYPSENGYKGFKAGFEVSENDLAWIK